MERITIQHVLKEKEIKKMSKQELKELGITIPESACDIYDDELDNWLEYTTSGRYTEDKMYDTRKYFDNKAVVRL